MQMTKLLVRHLKPGQRCRWWLVVIATVSSYKTRTPHVHDAHHGSRIMTGVDYCAASLQAVFLIVEMTRHWLDNNDPDN